MTDQPPAANQWAAALRVIEVARDIRDIIYGDPQPFPKAELDDALSAYDGVLHD